MYNNHAFNCRGRYCLKVIISFHFFVSVSLRHGKSISTGNLVERENIAFPVPDYTVHSHMGAPHGRQQQQQRPYSVAVPGFPQVGVSEMFGIF